MAINPIQFLLADNATATNGSNIITIQGTTLANTNASTVFSGSAVFVGNNQVVEGISGTAFDPATNTSTITLRNNWPHPTITARLVVFNTIEGLADAIRRARDAAAETSSLQSVFSDLILSTDMTIDVTIDGVTTAVTPYGYLEAQTTALLATATTVVEDITAVEGRVTVVEGELNTIEGTLNGLVTDAQAARTGAETAETNINASLVVFNSDLGTFNTNFASFTTDFGSFNTNYSQFQTDFGTFTTDFSTFSANFGTFQTDYAQFVTDFATIAGSVLAAGTSETNAAASAVIAQNASSISQSNANYVGDWADQTGALNIPASVRHNNAVWQLAVNLADVTTSEPSGINTDWFIIGTIGGIAPDSARLGSQLPSFYATASDLTTGLNGKVDTTITVNGSPLTANINITLASLGGVPTTRTINGNSLASNVSITLASLSGVPTTRTINGNALSSNVTITRGDLNASRIISVNDPANNTTFNTDAEKTEVEVRTGGRSHTITSGSYSTGSIIEINVIKVNLSQTIFTLSTGSINFPDGTSASTLELDPEDFTFNATLKKRSSTTWDLQMRT